MSVVHLAADHAGFELKEAISAALRNRGHEVVDLGVHSPERANWVLAGARLGREIAADPDRRRGVAVCGSGIGMSIVCNRFRGVRAALCHDVYTVEMSRRHNDANVLCLGARVVGAELALELVDLFLTVPFEGGRHGERLETLRSQIDRRDQDP